MNNPKAPEFWSEFYLNDNKPWQLPQPCPPVFDLLAEDSSLTPGRIAVVGCGTGPEPLALAKLGFDVLGLDLSPVAIEQANQIFGPERDFVAGSLEYREANLFKLDESYLGGFDYVFEQTCFCAISPDNRSDYVEAVHRLLKPSGRLIGVFFNIKVESPPPFGVEEREIRQRFGEHFSIEKLDLADNSFGQRAGLEWLAVFRKSS